MAAAAGLCKLGILLLFTAVVIQIVLLLGLTKKIYNHQPGPCRVVNPIVDGSEDVELLPNGLAVVTSGLRFIDVPELKNVVGKLYLYDFNSDSTNPKASELKIIPGKLDIKSFNPHGISSYTDNTGTTLYIINHGASGHSVEEFKLDVQKKAVTHLTTIRSELLYNPNDLVVVGPEQFYVTNDHYFNNLVLQTLEMNLPQMAFCSVVFYNKGQFSIVDNWVRAPNGVTTDPSKKFLFVAGGNDLLVYKINNDKSLTRTKSIELSSHCDNVFFDAESNSIWSGCHPIKHEIAAHIFYPKSKTAPTQVLRITFKNDFNDFSISDVYTNSGKELSGGTVAVRYKNQFLIGTVYHKLMLCNIAHSDTL